MTPGRAWEPKASARAVPQNVLIAQSYFHVIGMVGMKFGLSPGEVFFDVLATGSVFGVGATMATSASWPSSNYNTQKKFSRTQPEFHSNHTNRRDHSKTTRNDAKTQPELHQIRESNGSKFGSAPLTPNCARQDGAEIRAESKCIF